MITFQRKINQKFSKILGDTVQIISWSQRIYTRQLYYFEIFTSTSWLDRSFFRSIITNKRSKPIFKEINNYLSWLVSFVLFYLQLIGKDTGRNDKARLPNIQGVSNRMKEIKVKSNKFRFSRFSREIDVFVLVTDKKFFIPS